MNEKLYKIARVILLVQFLFGIPVVVSLFRLSAGEYHPWYIDISMILSLSAAVVFVIVMLASVFSE